MGAKHSLLSFSDGFSKRRFKGSAVRGLQAIPVDKIIGSVNRSHDYNFDFTKIKEGERTRDIERIMARGEGLPPIDVFQVGKYYYVEDGHHRVAIAKKMGQEFIDAYVTQYFFWSYEDYFHQKLGFDAIECSQPYYYKRLLDDIRNLRAEKYGERYVDFKQVADEWYAERYRPALDKILSSDIIKIHPKLPADFYCRYLKLKNAKKFEGKSFDDILTYMIRRYESPFYIVDKVTRIVLTVLIKIMKRMLKQGPPTDINPSS